MLTLGTILINLNDESLRTKISKCSGLFFFFSLRNFRQGHVFYKPYFLIFSQLTSTVNVFIKIEVD